jgi:hypothetical protein
VGFSFQISIHLRMSVLSWRTEVCAERRSFSFVTSTHQRWTRFLQLLEVRGEVRLEPWVREQPALDLGRLVCGAVVKHDVNVELVTAAPARWRSSSGTY